MSTRGRVPRRDVSGRTHRSAPTRWGRRSEPTENWREDGPCQRGEREWTDGGVWSPCPTGATQVMPSNGPMYLRYSFRQPNSEAEFGASVMGIGPYALRGTRDGGRHAGSSCPTGGCGEPPRLPWPAAHSGAFVPAGARKWVGIAAEIIPKVSSNFGQSLSHGEAVTAPFTQGSLRRRGMRIAASALRASSQ